MNHSIHEEEVKRMMTKRMHRPLSNTVSPRFYSAFLAVLLGIATGSSQICSGQSAPQSHRTTTSAKFPIEFEVATIKASEPGKLGADIGFKGHLFFANNQTLKVLIAFAYHLHPYQIAGGPAWIDTNKYDILAEAPSEHLSPSTIRCLFNCL
jgi:hypothetical protein